MTRAASPSYWTRARTPLWAVTRPSSTWTSSGNGAGALSILWCGEYSVSIRDVDMDETITTVKGREEAWKLRELLGEIKTKLWEDK
nr:MAG TPA: hypothetical protein [Caudoviricetes sp.]